MPGLVDFGSTFIRSGIPYGIQGGPVAGGVQCPLAKHGKLGRSNGVLLFPVPYVGSGLPDVTEGDRRNTKGLHPIPLDGDHDGHPCLRVDRLKDAVPSRDSDTASGEATPSLFRNFSFWR